jgi:ABC-type enterochelin transport system substrate-binding protein
MTLVSALARASVALVTVVVLSATAFAQSAHMTGTFSGAKVNAGAVTHSIQGGKHVLSLSSDFKVPDTPDPHWQVVDSKGTVHLLQRLGIKDNKVNTSITLPAYIKDVAKVQIYCAWAEAVLGEASFSSTLTLTE